MVENPDEVAAQHTPGSLAFPVPWARRAAPSLSMSVASADIKAVRKETGATLGAVAPGVRGAPNGGRRCAGGSCLREGQLQDNTGHRLRFQPAEKRCRAPSDARRVPGRDREGERPESVTE